MDNKHIYIIRKNDKCQDCRDCFDDGDQDSGRIIFTSIKSPEAACSEFSEYISPRTWNNDEVTLDIILSEYRSNTEQLNRFSNICRESIRKFIYFCESQQYNKIAETVKEKFEKGVDVIQYSNQSKETKKGKHSDTA